MKRPGDPLDSIQAKKEPPPAMAGPAPPGRPQQQANPSAEEHSRPPHWNQAWLDEYENVSVSGFRLYGYAKGFPCFSAWNVTPMKMASNSDIIYPSEEEMTIFHDFWDKDIYRKWQGFHTPGGYDQDGSLGEYSMLNQVRKWIENTKNYNVLFRYFNQNMFQRMNFFGLSSQSEKYSIRPAYFSEVVESPQEWKNMMMILFAAEFIETRLYNNPTHSIIPAQIIDFGWEFRPTTVAQVRLKELKKIGSDIPSFLPIWANTDDTILAALDDLGVREMIFNNQIIHKWQICASLYGRRLPWNRFKEDFVFPNLNGFQTFEDLQSFVNLVNDAIRNEVQRKMTPFAWKEKTGVMLEIKQPDFPSIFEALKGETSVVRFKELWKSTAAGDGFLDEYAAWAHHRPSPNMKWPPTSIDDLIGFDKENHGATDQYDGAVIRAPAVEQPIGKNNFNREEFLNSWEGRLLSFMVHYAPPRLKRPPITNWKLSRMSDEWLKVFNKQWDDYFIWCQRNIEAQNTSYKDAKGKSIYARPGEQLKDKEGNLLFHIEKKYSKKGKPQEIHHPLMNIYPDYGIMTSDADSNAWYRSTPILAAFFWVGVADFVWGDKFWDGIKGFIHEMFQHILDALQAIVDWVEDHLPDLAKIGLFIFVIGVALIGGGSYVSQIGANLAGG